MRKQMWNVSAVTAAAIACTSLIVAFRTFAITRTSPSFPSVILFVFFVPLLRIGICLRIMFWCLGTNHRNEKSDRKKRIVGTFSVHTRSNSFHWFSIFQYLFFWLQSEPGHRFSPIHQMPPIWDLCVFKLQYILLFDYLKTMRKWEENTKSNRSWSGTLARKRTRRVVHKHNLNCNSMRSIDVRPKYDLWLALQGSQKIGPKCQLNTNWCKINEITDFIVVD